MGEASVITETITPYTVPRRPIHRFTPENARLNGLRSAAIKKQRAEEQKALLAAQPLTTPNQQAATTGFASTRARIIERQIDETMAEYGKEKDPKAKQALAMAMDRLYGIWADLTGFERRGVSRGSKRRSSQPPLAGSNSPEDI